MVLEIMVLDLWGSKDDYGIEWDSKENSLFL